MAFTEDEIISCLFDCNGDKTPGPNGLNMKFLQEFWSVFKKDIMDLFNEFCRNWSFVRSLNTTFFVLIAKKRAKNINDFKSISLVGCIYKLISIVLDSIKVKVLRKVIGECQHAFMDGRQIIDGS